MTGADEELSLKAMGILRRLTRKLAQECFARGITAEDLAMSSLFATFDIAQAFKSNDPFAAVEFLRDGADLIERQLMEGTRQ